MKKRSESNPESEERRKYLKMVGALVAGLAVGGAAGWLSKPAERITETITETVTKTVTVPITPTPTPTPTPKKVKIRAMALPDVGDSTTGFAKDFMKENPDIEVEVVVLSWELAYPKQLEDVRTGTGAYDTMTIDVMTAGALAGGMEDLEAFRAKHPEVVDPDYGFDDFDPNFYYITSMWKEKHIGLPYFNDMMLFYYRKDYFENSSLRAKFKEMFGRELEPPKTWEETVDVAKFFTKEYNPDSPTDYGIALMFPRAHTIFYMYVIFFGPFRRSPEGLEKFGKVDLDYGDFFTEKHEPAFNSPEGVKAFELMEALMPYAPDPLGSDWGETLEYFARGLVATVPQWTGVWWPWRESPELSPIEEKVGCSMMPGGVSVSGPYGFCINDDSKYKVEAYKWIQYCTDKNRDRRMVLEFGLPPNRISTCKDPEVIKVDPRLPVILETMKTYGHRPRIVKEPEIEDIAITCFSEIISGARTDKAAALQELADEWMRILGS